MSEWTGNILREGATLRMGDHRVEVHRYKPDPSRCQYMRSAYVVYLYDDDPYRFNVTPSFDCILLDSSPDQARADAQQLLEWASSFAAMSMDGVAGGAR